MHPSPFATFSNAVHISLADNVTGVEVIFQLHLIYRAISDIGVQRQPWLSQQIRALSAPRPCNIDDYMKYCG